MTQQMQDRFRYGAVDYDLVDFEGRSLFEPAAHGLQIAMASTAAWRGYVCGYVVDAGGQLVLDELTANLGRFDDDGNRFVPQAPPLLNGHRARVAEPPFNARYLDLGLPIAFTGGVLIGTDLDTSVERQEGQVPWRYRRAYLLGFDDGALTEETDLSATLASWRANEAARREWAARQPDLSWLQRGRA